MSFPMPGNMVLNISLDSGPLLCNLFLKIEETE